MTLTKWKLRDMVIELPSSWNKEQVVKFANTDIKVCCQCGKIDIPLTHYSNCNPVEQQQREQREQNLWYKD